MTKETNKPKILLVEDDVNLGFLLVEYFESNGFDVKLYIDGEAGLKGFELGVFNICLIDIMLPKLDGFSLVKAIKKLEPEMPVIILSARSLKEDKIKGFDFGVDDYITKPFDEDELLCRVKAVLNRRYPAPSNNERNRRTQMQIGSFEFNSEKQQLIQGQHIQGLTYKECKILKHLVQSKNNLVKREEIMVEVWGESTYYNGRSLDVFISKLRSYLKSDPSLHIKTIPTVGYILEE